jgi:hypothetical protein
VIAYPATLDVPVELVRYLARLLAAERRRRGTRKGTRAATAYRQAVFVLAWFRKREDIAVLGAGFGLSRATAYRYHAEGIAVLAAQAPDLHQVLEQVKQQGWAYVILDGTIIGADRDSAAHLNLKGQVVDRWYSGKNHEHGGLLQALMRPDGVPVWLSAVEPGSTHDLAAARVHVLPALYPAAAGGPADPGRRRLHRRRHRYPRPHQTTRRHPDPRHKHPHPQRPTARATRPR